MKWVITALIVAACALVALGVWVVTDQGDRVLPGAPPTRENPTASPTGTPDDSVKPIGDLGRIAFLRDRSQAWGNRVLIRLDGHRPPQSPSRTFAYMYRVDWSPDGRSVVTGRGLSEGHGAIVVIDVRTGNERVLYTDEGSTRPINPQTPSWSPDGSTIAFSDGEGDIYLIGAEGGAHRKVHDSSGKCGNSAPDWSPDGRTLAVSQSGICKRGIYLMPSRGGTLERLTEGSGDLEPAWSPDGTMIAYSGGDGPGRQVIVVDVDTGEESQLTDSLNNYMPSWSPDGTQIVFGSNRTGDQNIWLMDADGTDERQLTFGRQNDISPAWAPN